jgi:DNA-binding protein H-NS
MAEPTLEQLQQRLADLETEWNEVEAAIAEKLEEDKKQLAEEITQKIKDAGHELGEMIGLISPRRRRGSTAINSYTTYVDPDNPNNTYVRGVLPGWLKNKMRVTGFDPSKKEDRETFKAKHLKTVSD